MKEKRHSSEQISSYRQDQRQKVLNILQVGDRWSVTNGGGGAGRVLAALVNHLPYHGLCVHGLVAEPLEVAKLTNGTVQSYSDEILPTGKRIIAARERLSKFIRSTKVDLIASHFALYIAFGLDKLKLVPHVVHFHGPWAAESREEGAGPVTVAAKQRIESAVYKRADRVIVLSASFAKLIQRNYGVEATKIVVVPGAVDVDSFNIQMTRKEARNILNWPHDRPTLVAIRRLSKRMGLDHLIEAMVQVKASHPEAILFIGGEGNQRDALNQLVNDLHLEKHVYFLGFVPSDLLALTYRAADVNIVPTRALEGFGLVAAEGLSAGTPSMVTPIGGLPEVVSGLSPSLVFRSSSIADIADGIVKALSGQIDLPNAESCRRYAEENFSIELMVKRTAEVYRDVVNSR